MGFLCIINQEGGANISSVNGEGPIYNQLRVERYV